MKSYKDIDLNKILGDQIYPDEEIVYVAKSHWSLLLGILWLLIFPIGVIISDR